MPESLPPIPIACNPHALSAVEWAQHREATDALFQRMVQAIDELPDGYAFHFPADAYPKVAHFVERERRCCPFFQFALILPPADAALTLQISGAPAAKAILLEELVRRRDRDARGPA